MNKVVDFADQIADRALQQFTVPPKVMTSALYGFTYYERVDAVEEIIKLTAAWAAREGYNLASGVKS